MATRKQGRPTKLTPKLQADVCKAIATQLLPMRWACAMVGINETVISLWRQRADKGEQPFLGFFEAVEKAKGEGIARQYKRKGGGGLKAEFKLKVADPKTFNAPERVVIESELTGAVARLKERFKNGEQISLEDALSAIAGEPGGEGAGGAEGGEGEAAGGEGGGGSEAVRPAPAVGDATPVPGAGS